MPTSGSRASLMDDLDFVAELEKFDARPIASARSSSSDAFEDLEDVWESRATFAEPPPDVEEMEYAAPVIEERLVVRDVAGFLLMMALGGAAAVLVFHDRVALLLR